MRAAAAASVILLLASCAPAQVSSTPATGTVVPGIEVFLSELPETLRGKRVGLITNQSAFDDLTADRIGAI